MKKLVLPLGMVVACCGFSSAADYVVGGLGYNVLSDVTMMAQVADCNGATGDVVIPRHVSINGTDYVVTEIAAQAFLESKITSVSIPEDVEKIGDGAFGHCAQLKSVKYNAIKCPTAGGSGNMSAFYGCDALQSVTIGEEVSAIPPYIFSGLGALRSIAIPRKVTEIGNQAFANCTGVSQVYIDAAKLGTSSSAFSGCTNFMSVIISDNVTVVPAEMFIRVAGVRSVTIGKAVEVFGKGCFADCDNLKTVTYNCEKRGVSTKYSTSYTLDAPFGSCDALSTLVIGDEVVEIPDGMFTFCHNLTSITFGKKLERICDYAFYKIGLASFKAPASLKYIGNGAFQGSQISNAEFNEGLEFLSGFNETQLKVAKIPSTVKTIGYRAFPESLSSVEGIGSDNIEFIGAYAFSNTKITGALKLGNGLKTMEERAFYSCSGLTSLSLGSAVETIGDCAFYECKGFKGRLVLPASLKHVGTDAFRFNTGLTGALVIPEQIEYLGRRAFGECYNIESLEYNAIAAGDGGGYGDSNSGVFNMMPLKSITIGDKVRSFPLAVFQNMYELENVVLPTSVKSLPNYAFYKCTALKSVVLPDGFEKLGDNAFEYCPALTELVIPESVLEMSRLQDMEHFEKLVFNARECKNVGSNFYASDLPSLKKVVIGPNVEKLQVRVFQSNNVQLVEWNARNIGEIFAAHKAHSLGTVVLAEDVERFYGFNFSTVISCAPVPPALSLPNVGAEAYVPDAAVYRQDSNWGKYLLRQYVTWTGTTDGEKLGYETNFPYELTLKHYLDAEGNVMDEAPCEIGDYKAVFTYAIEDEVFELPSSFSIKANTTNTMFTDDVRAYRGRQVVIPVKMVNDRQITSFQFDLYLPQGMKLAEDEYGDPMIEFTSRKSNTHTIASSVHADGSVRIASFSSRNAPFAGNDGDLLLLTVDVAQDAPEGEAVMSLRNIRMVEPDAHEVITNRNDSRVVISGMVEGDTNDDTFVTMADVVNVVNYVLGETPEVFVFDAADLNGDGEITMADAVAVMAIALEQGAANPAAAKVAGVVAAEDETQLENRISIEPLSLVQGQTGTLHVNLDNEAQITSFQFDLLLPEGLSIPVDEEGEPMIALSAGRTTNTHMIASRYQPDGSLRIVAFSSKNRPFKGNSGAFVDVEVKADESLANGDYPVGFSTIYLIQPDSYQFAQPAFTDMVHVGTSGIASPVVVSGFSVRGLTGEIVVTAAEATGVTIYDLSGVLVSQRDVPAGETRIAVAPGFYVVNGHKVFVK